MEIFGIGMGEGIFILVVMLVIVGPERMIRWAFTIGQYAGKLQSMWRETASALQKELDASGAGVSVPREIPTRRSLHRDMTRALQGVVQPATDPLRDAGKELGALTRETSSSLTGIAREERAS
jgi:Sec-independent protein translocase protein TatA